MKDKKIILKPKLTSERLIRNGYFPKELPPPFTTSSLADCMANLPGLDNLKPKSSRSILFSIPKSWPARRTLSVPNPLHQMLLCNLIAEHWTEFKDIYKASTISLSTPTTFKDGVRTVSRKVDFDTWSAERFQRSADSRVVLRTDFSRFYHTIYTHSLPWAIHGKSTAKANQGSGLFGNAIDTCVRNTQDKQTIGPPVGPDTSFILAELIGARIDQDLQQELPNLRGTRYVDDFHLYFDSKSDAEAAFSILTRIAKHYELDVNDRKTQIFDAPDTGEPAWKTAIKAQRISGTGTVQRSSLVSFISKSFDLFQQYTGEGVLPYAIKKATAIKCDVENADVFEAFLRAAMIRDSSTMPLVVRILFDRHEDGTLGYKDELLESLSKLILFHATFRNQYEVSWALWLFRALKSTLPDKVADAIAEMEDSFIVLLALDLRDCGLVDQIETEKWTALMNSDSLFTEHWPLAYEAAQRGWLDLPDGNYNVDDPFFSLLAANEVSFYKAPADSGVDYVSLGSTEGY